MTVAHSDVRDTVPARQREETEVQAATGRSNLLTLLVVLAFAVLGYVIAPPDLLLGEYTAHITVQVDGRMLEAAYPFRLGDEAGSQHTISVPAGSYQVIVEGQEAVPYRLNERITYRMHVVDEAGNPVPLELEDVSSTLVGPAYEQVLPPTERDADLGALIFTMRVPYKAKIVTGLLFAVAVLWLTELIPLAATALCIPVVVVVAGVTDATTVLQPFAHPIIILFLAGFLMAEGMHRTGVDRLIALNILRRASLKPAYLMLTMMALTAFLSMWMSNTASVAIIIPIALALLDKMSSEIGETGFRRALVLGVAYAATIGGIGSAIGTPANILAITFLSEFAGTQLAFVDWFAYGLPMVIVMIPVAWLYLILAFRVKFSRLSGLSRDVYRQELRDLGRLTSDQRVVLITFLGVMVLWLTERVHGVPTAIVALIGALVLFFAKSIREEDLNRINWNALLTFGGGLSIGGVLVYAGVSDWVALQLTGLAHQPALLVVILVATLTLVTGAFISNTACAAMLIPLAIPLAKILHMDPRLLVAVVAIASSIDFALVVGTPPTMMAYSTGIFEVKDIAKRGVVLDVVGILVLSLGVVWVWQSLGVVTLP